jgi:predicted RND superfamily exporter protein
VAFERWGDLLARRRGRVLALVLAAAVGLAAAAAGLRIDNSVEAFLHEDDPALLRYNELRDRFGRDDLVVIALKPPEVFDPGFLGWLRALHDDLEQEVPYVDEVTSLWNARFTRGEETELVVGDLLEEPPRTAEDLAQLRERVFSNPLYLDGLVSRDGRITTVSIEPVTYSPRDASADALGGFDDDPAPAGADAPAFLSDVENMELVAAVRAVMESHRDPAIEMHLAGAPVVEERLEVEMQNDLVRFLGLSLLVVTLALFVLLRRMAGVALPLLTVALSLPTTLGVMSLMDIPLSLTTEILPPYLLTVGVCYSIHVVVIFFQAHDRGLAREAAVRHALRHSGLAVVMTGLTTAGGLVSFAWAQVAPVSHLGIVGPAGVVLAVFFSLVLLPALLLVVPLGPPRSGARAGPARLRRALVRCGELSSRYPIAVVAVSLVVMAAAAVGASRLRFANDYMEWFPEHEPIRTATAFVDRELRGSVTLEAIVDTGSPGALLDPALLRSLERVGIVNASVQRGALFIGKTLSVADIVMETHQALNENRSEFRTIPGSKELVAQELLLFENGGREDLAELADAERRTARISMRIPWADWMLYPDFLADVQRNLEQVLGGDVAVGLTGFSALMARAAESFVVTMVRSYAVALVVITPLMIFLLGSLRLGMLSMLPNLAPVLLTLGLMGWLDIPLDMSTTLIGGIILGLAVDDTIHFVHGFQRAFAARGDARQAVRETLETTGTAMLFTSLVLGAGFLVFTLAYTDTVAVFGWLTAFATFTAFLADVTLAPALMVLAARR